MRAGDGDGAAAASSGSLLARSTYNVAGLPEGISGSHPAVNTALIAPRLNAYDLVLMQETWQTPEVNPLAPLRVYHEILVAGSQHPYKSVSATQPFNTDPDRPSAILGDGLNTFSRFRFDDITRQRWSGCWDTAADCLALKGFSMIRMVLPVRWGRWTWTTCTTRRAALPRTMRSAPPAWRTWRRYINTYSAGRAVIVGRRLQPAHQYRARFHPVPGFDRRHGPDGFDARALGCADPGRIDKILVRSSAQVTLTPVAYSIETASFLDGNGDSLSDHEPVAVRIDWTVTP